MALAVADENINMETEIPDESTEGSACNESELASKGKDSSLNEEVDTHSMSDEIDVNQSDDDHDEEIISKDILRQSTKTLDDPSQFYFDDDIPTPGLSEDSSTREDIEGIGEETDDEDNKKTSGQKSAESDLKEGRFGKSEKLTKANIKGSDSKYEVSRDSEDFRSEEEDEQSDEEDRSGYEHEDMELSYEEEKEVEEGGERKNEEQEERDEEIDDEEGSIIMDESEDESEIEEEESENERELEENDGEIPMEDDEDEDVNSHEAEEEEEEIDSGGEDDNDEDKSESIQDNVEEDKLNGNSHSESEIEDKEDLDKESNCSKDKVKSDEVIDEDSKRKSFTDSSISPSKTGCDNKKVKEEDSCLGFLIRQTDLEKLTLRKEILLSCIDRIERFLNPNLPAKEWEGTKKDEFKYGDLFKWKQPVTNDVKKVAVKRKRSGEDSPEPVVKKKDGRGRPKGWRKVKPEMVETASQDYPKSSKTKVENRPMAKRSKKDQLLLLKALDEEMFKMDEDSNKEMERISQGLEYQCSVCSQVFIEKKNLSKHFFKCLMKFTQSGRSSFKCAVCFEYFSLIGSLEAHIEKKHSDVCDEPFQCAQCSLCFEEGCLLKSHVLEKHEVFQCGHCEKYYRTQAMLDVHVSKKHDGVNVKIENSSGETSKGSQENNEVVKKTELEVKGRGRPKRKNQTEAVTSQTTVNPQVPTERGQDYATVQVKLEQLDSSIANVNLITNEAEPVKKKKGRPFKNQPLNEVKRIPKTNVPSQSVKAGPTKSEVSKSKSDIKASSMSSTEEASSEETELGRGRRVKKKKALDYEDISLPVRAVSKPTERNSAVTQNSIIKKEDNFDRIKVELNHVSLLPKSNVFGDVKTAANRATTLPRPHIYTLGKSEIKKETDVPKPSVLGEIKTEGKKATVLSPSTVYGRPVASNPQPTQTSQPVKTTEQPPVPVSTPVKPPELPKANECTLSTGVPVGTAPRPLVRPSDEPSNQPSVPRSLPLFRTSDQSTNQPTVPKPLPLFQTPDQSTNEPTEPKPSPQTSDQSTIQPTDESASPPTTPNRKAHVCPKCRKAFAHKYLVKVHMKWKHNIYKRNTVVEPASSSGGADANSPKKVRRHRTPISARGALFDCILCKESFPKFSTLDEHYLKDHDGIPCPVCRILMKTRCLLEKHLASCHPEADPCVCPVCDKRMASKATLRKHFAMHEDRRPYACAVCKRTFRYSYDMRLHMRRTHKRQTEPDSEASATDNVS